MAETHIEQRLLDLLCCPKCHGELLLEENAALICKPCSLKYPIKDGIPILLLEEAEQLKSSSI